MKRLAFSLILTLSILFSTGCSTENPVVLTPTDVVKAAGCVTDIEKSDDGYYILRADSACIDGLFADPIDITDTQLVEETPAVCNAPFGVDSQQILNELALGNSYKIGTVSDIDLERNDDGTWYVADCRILGRTLYFQAPHPQQNEINDGDIIGFQATTKCNTTWRGTTCWYSSGKLIENISLQSADCQIDDVNQLSNPSTSMPILASKDDFVDVTGVIMAVETTKNFNPEPDNPHDHLIKNAVMKCKDGNLYRISFVLSYRADKFGIERVKVNYPSQNSFGEGDIVTVKQTNNLFEDSFQAYYEP